MPRVARGPPRPPPPPRPAPSSLPHLPPLLPLSQGKTDLADTLLADDAVHIDEIWGGGSDEVVAGRVAIKAFVTRVRAAYPDFWVEPDSYGQCGARRMFVRWSGRATNLGAYHGHKPSRHASAVSGIDLFTFTPDRSAIAEVLVYRTPLAEDRVELASGGGGGGGVAGAAGGSGDLGSDGLHELRLNRLHDKPPPKGWKG